MIFNYLADSLVPRPGVEPGWILLHWCLRPARLPIPPSGHLFFSKCAAKVVLIFDCANSWCVFLQKDYVREGSEAFCRTDDGYFLACSLSKSRISVSRSSSLDGWGGCGGAGAASFFRMRRPARRIMTKMDRAIIRKSTTFWRNVP